MKELKDIKKESPEYTTVGSQVLKDVISRLHKAYDKFFRRVKQGIEAPGFPRFKGKRFFNSFTFPNSSGWRYANGLEIQNVGRFKLRGGYKIIKTWHVKPDRTHLEIQDKDTTFQVVVRTVTVKRSNTGKWYVTFTCDNAPAKPVLASTATIGIDVGTMLFSMDSDGKRIPRGGFLEGELRQLRILQRKAARQREAMKREKRATSNHLEKTYDAIRRLHEHIANCRLDFICKLSHYYVQNYGTIRVENLDILNIIQRSKRDRKPPIARLRILDAAWGTFFQRLKMGAESAGRTYEEVSAEYTTMTCSRCGHVQKVALALRMFDCEKCKLRIHRKFNAARNINQEQTLWESENLSGIVALLSQIRQEYLNKEAIQSHE